MRTQVGLLNSLTELQILAEREMQLELVKSVTKKSMAD